MRVRYHSLVTSLVIFLLTGFHAQAQKKCITREDQIYTSPIIESIVNKLGGIKNLEGQWRLSGLAGALKRVTISFKSEGDGLKGFVQGLDDDTSGKTWAALTICETVRPDTVFIRIHGEEEQIFMSPVSTRTMRIAQFSNGKTGSYYSFTKQ